MKNAVVTKHFLQFGENTTAHGLHAFTLSGIRWRVLWAIAITSLWIILGWHIVIVCLDYSHYPTNTIVKHEYSDKIPFPVLTFCNLNPVRIGLPEVEAILGKQLRDIDTYLDNATSANTFKFNAVDHTLKLTIAELLYDNWNGTFGHQLDDVLVECSSQACVGMLNVTWHHGLYGNCFSLRVNEDMIVSAGANYGLRLLLTAESWYYDNDASPITGFRIQLHPLTTAPFPEDDGFTVSTGSAVEVAMAYEAFSRLPLPYDGTDCYELASAASRSSSLYLPLMQSLIRSLTKPNETNLNPQYSHEACFKSNLYQSIFETCGCAVAFGVTKNLVEASCQGKTIFPCDSRDLSTHQCWLKAEANLVKDHLKTKCPVACSEATYSLTISKSEFPSKVFTERVFLKKLETAKSQVSGLDFFRHIGLKLSDTTTEEIKNGNVTESLAEIVEEAQKNYVDLNIYINDFSFLSITEDAKWGFADLMSNIGGLMGLYSGMSFLTLVEFFQCFAVLFGRKDLYRKHDEEGGLHMNTINGKIGTDSHRTHSSHC